MSAKDRWSVPGIGVKSDGLLHETGDYISYGHDVTTYTLIVNNGQRVL